jgi:hypothetical protein
MGFWSSINLKEGTRLQLQRRFYQTAPICNLRQIVHIYPNVTLSYASNVMYILWFGFVFQGKWVREFLA